MKRPCDRLNEVIRVCLYCLSHWGRHADSYYALGQNLYWVKDDFGPDDRHIDGNLERLKNEK